MHPQTMWEGEAMSNTVALEVPQELYEALQAQAKKKGQEPDILAIEWLTEAIQQASAIEDDPLIQLFGTLESDITDIAEQHDVYIGRELVHKLRDHE
jgi:hypothetical protein